LPRLASGRGLPREVRDIVRDTYAGPRTGRDAVSRDTDTPTSIGAREKELRYLMECPHCGASGFADSACPHCGSRDVVADCPGMMRRPARRALPLSQRVEALEVCVRELRDCLEAMARDGVGWPMSEVANRVETSRDLVPDDVPESEQLNRDEVQRQMLMDWRRGRGVNV
jgi:hypothetical protein